MQSSAICNGEQGRSRGVEDGCDFTLIVWVHKSVHFVCVYACVHMGWEVLVEFLRAMLILQAQQGCSVCVCVAKCAYESQHECMCEYMPACVLGNM